MKQLNVMVVYNIEQDTYHLGLSDPGVELFTIKITHEQANKIKQITGQDDLDARN